MTSPASDHTPMSKTLNAIAWSAETMEPPLASASTPAAPTQATGPKPQATICTAARKSGTLLSAVLIAEVTLETRLPMALPIDLNALPIDLNKPLKLKKPDG